MLDTTASPITSTRQEQIHLALKNMVKDLTGLSLERIDPHTTFLEMGADSLSLLRTSQIIQNKFGVKVPFRQLIEEYSTVSALASHIEQQLPAEEPTPTPSAAVPAVPVTPVQQADASRAETRATAPAPQTQLMPLAPPANAAMMPPDADDEAGPLTALERIMAQQLQLMQQQLEVLRGSYQTDERPFVEPKIEAAVAPEQFYVPASATPEPQPEPARQATQTRTAEAPAMTTHPAPSAFVSEGLQAKGKSIEPEQFTAYQPVNKEGVAGLTRRQQQSIEELVARVTRRTSKSKSQTQRHRSFWADSRMSAGFRSLWKEMVYQIISERAAGSHIWDIDGNEYVDITMGFGSLLFGHSPSFVIEAMQEQLQSGIQLGPQSHRAGQVARLICELTGVERVAFCNSGTEAVMSALRLARAVTGRTRIALFSNSYHGTFDGILVRGEEAPDGTLQAAPIAPGISPRMIEDVLLLHYNNPRSYETLEENASELAAVMIELPRSRRPDVHPTELLKKIRRLTEETGTALIFDEVVTGFRIHPGGAQAFFGVQADIVTYGKSVGAGMPIGVVAGKAKYLDAIDGGFWSYGDDSYPRAATTLFAGTYFKHPLVMAAAWAGLNHLKNSGAALQEGLNQRTSQLGQTLNEFFEQRQLPIKMVNFGSAFSFIFSRELKFKELFFYHLLEKGVYVWEGRVCYLSTAHTDEDIERIIEAVRETVIEMQKGDLLPVSADDARELAEHPAASNGNGFHPAAVETSEAAVQADAVETQERASPRPEGFLEGNPAPVTCTCNLADANGVQALPITEGQKVLWFLAQMGEDASAAYNGLITLQLHGVLNAAAMRKALKTLVNRHKALRTTFSEDGSHQHVATRVGFDVPLIDFSSLDRAEREAEVKRWLSREAERPFDLSRGPLCRSNIVKLEGEYHLLTLNTHHIVTDGWSYGVMLKELRILYEAECLDRPFQLPEPVQFSEYAYWQAAQQESPEMHAAEAFWLGQFADSVPTLELPADHPRPSVRTYNGAQQRMIIEESLLARLEGLSARHGCTLYMTVMAAVKVLLHRLSGQEDIVMGIVSAGQPLVGNSLVGYCTNLLPVRTQPRGEITFSQYLLTAKSIMLDAYEHQNYPFNRLIEKLNLPRDNSRSPLAIVGFNLDRGTGKMRFHGLDVLVDTHPNNFAHFEIYFNIVQSEEGLVLECTYNTDLYDHSTIERWKNYLKRLVESIANDSEQRLKDLPLLDEEERRRLLFDDNPSPDSYPDHYCLHELFEAQVAKTPEKVAALGTEGRPVTYGELSDLSNKLAALIKEIDQ